MDHGDGTRINREREPTKREREAGRRTTATTIITTTRVASSPPRPQISESQMKRRTRASATTGRWLTSAVPGAACWSAGCSAPAAGGSGGGPVPALLNFGPSFRKNVAPRFDARGQLQPGVLLRYDYRGRR